MATYNKKPNFKVKVNYPTTENYNEYEGRKASVIAKILVDTVSLYDINDLINKLTREKKR